MKGKLVALAALLSITLLMGLAAPTAAAKATPVFAEVIWAEGDLWGTVLTPSGLGKGPAKSFDALYVFDGSGLAGQRPIAEAAPGDRDYNGGRWQVFPVTFTAAGIAAHDPDGDGLVNFELMSDGQLLAHMGLGHLTIASEPVMQFECPLVPAK